MLSDQRFLTVHMDYRMVRYVDWFPQFWNNSIIFLILVAILFFACHCADELLKSSFIVDPRTGFSEYWVCTRSISPLVIHIFNFWDLFNVKPYLSWLVFIIVQLVRYLQLQWAELLRIPRLLLHTTLSAMTSFQMLTIICMEFK